LIKSLQEIYKEALDDATSKNINRTEYESQVLHGVQIIKEFKTNKITIYPATGMDYYDEISPRERIFFERGWKYGVFKVTIEKYIADLDRIKDRKRKIINSTKSQRDLDRLTAKKNKIMNKYYKIKQKLNQLK